MEWEGFEKTLFVLLMKTVWCLAAEAVQGAALALERVHDVEGRDGLAAGVLGVGDGGPDDVPEADPEHPAGPRGAVAECATWE